MSTPSLKKFVALAVLLFAFVTAAQAYPNVTIKNLTKYTASGEVNYAACKNDKFTVAPGATWKGPNRGACLITWISANLSGWGQATKYTSSGTGFAEFVIGISGNGYEVYRPDQEPTGNRAPLDVAKKPIFNIAHMVTTDKAVDWAVSKGANGLEMDMHFDKTTGVPKEFRHGGICDCACSAVITEHVCSILGTNCEVSAPLEPHLEHIATKLTVGMIIIDSKVDKDSLGDAAQKTAGKGVVDLLVKHLFEKGFRGFALVSAPESKYIAAYLKAAVDQANTTKFKDRIYFGVDMDNGGGSGAATTIAKLRALPTQKLIYGCGISSCIPGEYFSEISAAAQAQDGGAVKQADVWSIDKESSMKKYIWLGARGILTNRPGVLAGVIRDLKIPLAQPGYLP